MMSVWTVVIVAAVVPLLESRTLSLTETTSLNRFLGEVARCARVPAISLSLVRDGQIVYANGFGTANKHRQQQASSKSIFCLGDITQTFTATLLAKLLHENQNYTWDTPVREILGGAVTFGDKYRDDFLSLRDILAMRTGISNMDAVVMTKAMDRGRLMSNLRFSPKVSSFRGKYVHNNLLFVLAEEVVRNLGQDTWYKLMRDKILHPLGMTNTFFINTDARDQDRLAQPVMSYNGAPMAIPMEALKGHEIIAAGTAVCSTAEDMATWMLLNNQEGVTQEGGQLLPPELLTELFEGQSIRGNGNPMVEGFGQPDIQVAYSRDSNALGWIKGNYRGYTVISQDGSLPGFESLMSLIPSRKAGVFTAFTGDSGIKAFAAKTLVNIYGLDLLIHGQQWFNINNFCQILDKLVSSGHSEDAYMARGIKQATESPRPLEDYQGYYRNLAFGDIKVWVNGSMFLKYGEMGEYVLRPTNKEHVFIMEAVPGNLWFTTHVDIFRRKPYLAFFNTTEYSDNHIENLKIPHFDKNTDPLFSKRVRMPLPYDKAEPVCSGSSKLLAGWTVLLLVAIGFLKS